MFTTHQHDRALSSLLEQFGVSCLAQRHVGCSGGGTVFHVYWLPARKSTEKRSLPRLSSPYLKIELSLHIHIFLITVLLNLMKWDKAVLEPCTASAQYYQVF